ncbi:hypothetical protein [Streptosporangium sp. NPDC023615]|uniref:hypothetical protein n=1 Tax=Streptosporangium sp. NPDC023615 TaxID=3154794 RepID=UPI00342F0C2F
MAIAAATQEIVEAVVTKRHVIWFYIVSSEEIWQQFGVATWRTQQARLVMVLSACFPFALVAAALWWSGALTPQVEWSAGDFFLHAEVDRNGVLSTTLRIEVENRGLAAFTLTDLATEMPGLRFLPADGSKNQPSEVTVHGGDSERLERRVVITDCAAVPHEPQPVRFSYRTWTGSRTTEATWDSWWLQSPEKDVPVAWQRGLVGKVCSEAVNPGW